MKFSRLLFTVALLLAALTSICPRAFAENVDVDLDAANRAYQNGHYEESARLFQHLIDQRGFSAPLCFDLGNAEEKAGHTGLALLNYERARYLAPGDTDINHNLQLARRQAALDPDPYRWWEVVIRSINWMVWLVVILLCLTLLLAATIGAAFAPSLAAALKIPLPDLRKIFKGVFFTCIPLFLFFGFVELSTIGFGDRIEGVIIARQATLRLSPFESSERTGSIPEGELVTVEQSHDGYYWIDDRSRQSGWVKSTEVEPVIAGSFDPASK